jgi:hypothetical protein
MADTPAIPTPTVAVKPWWASKTIWSDVLTIFMALAPAVDSIWATHITTSPFYAQGLMLLGAMGIHGRITSNTQIGGN